MHTLVQFFAGALWIGIFTTVIVAGIHESMKEKR